MKKIEIDLSRYKPTGKKKITNERQSIIKDFLDILNASRKAPYKPLTAGFVASKMSMLGTQQLRIFFSECKYSKNFSKYWWWSINPKKQHENKYNNVESF